MSIAWIVLAAAAGLLAVVLYAQWRRDQRDLRDFLPPESDGQRSRPGRIFDHERER